MSLSSGKVDPDGGSQRTGSRPCSTSSAVASNCTTAPFGPVASAVIPPSGRCQTGGPPSTVTAKRPSPTPPVRGSTAEQLTKVLPIGNVAPEAGLQATAAPSAARAS